jgi:DNA primase
MKFDDHLLDDIRARLSVSQVVGRRVSLKKKGREFAGLSPFKVEKSASFFVNDQKGFYHCFASGEHGDIFTFVMKTEGLSFPEAVERLAQEAGVAMPERTREARDPEVQDQRERLYALLKASADYFRAQLAGNAGTVARTYITRRGLKRETVTTFGMGFAPNSRFALKEHLAEKGFSVPDMVASGMLIGGEDIPVPYDRFRNRVMFPITDLKDRVIAFGGRALEADQPAKYLNSPETPLFHKGHILFNAARARPLAHTSGQILVVEGYMDVVALAEAGFGAAVAPLGTALTEDQIKLLWRIVPEPTLCFDGDSAGQKAAFRAIDTVLPHLKPGASLSFAFLPDGLDPDDLVRQRGAKAMADLVANPRPLADVLFERELALGDVSTPERRAGIEHRMRELTRSIQDPDVRGQYERDMRDRLFRAFRAASFAASVAARPPQSAPSAGGWTGARPQQAGAGSRRSPQQRAGVMARTPYSDSLKRNALTAPESTNLPRGEAVLLQAIVVHPWLLNTESEAIARIVLTGDATLRLRAALLSTQAQEKALDRESVRHQLESLGFGTELAALAACFSHRSDKFIEPEADEQTVLEGWLDALRLHERHGGSTNARHAAELAWRTDLSEDAAAEIFELHNGLAAARLDEEIVEPQPAAKT